MFEVYEMGLFLKNNYQLHVQYDTEPDEKQKELIHRISEWNADPDRFTPAKVCGIFHAINNSGAECKGLLRKRNAVSVPELRRVMRKETESDTA